MTRCQLHSGNNYSPCFLTLLHGLMYHLTREKYKVASLDVLVMLGQYRLVLGKIQHDLCKNGLNLFLSARIFVYFSTVFFARKPSHFFRMWEKKYDIIMIRFFGLLFGQSKYGELIMSLLLLKKPIDIGKTNGILIAFFVLQRDWKGISQNDLSIAHALLYEGDFRIKNGGSDLFLDLFCTSFFNVYGTCNR